MKQLLFAILVIAVIQANAAAPKYVAGRLLTDWVRDLDSENETRRLRAARTIGIFGESALVPLSKMLSREDPSIRYWAASHLGDLGSKAKRAVDSLKKTQAHNSQGVRMATAYALCRINDSSEHLGVLIDALQSKERGTACSAADFLGRLGPLAKKALPELEGVFRKHKDYHIRGSAKNALRYVKNDFTLQNHQRPTDGGQPRTWSQSNKQGPPARNAEQAAQRPNILWISCEDISPNLGCYGDSYASTPNLDRLASQGVRYTHAFTPAGVCAVVRSGIITGVYPISIGSQHMRSRIVTPPHIKAFPEYLRAAGYFTSNKSKTDYQFEDPLPAWDRNGGGHNDWRDRKPGQPFFSVINLTISHESQIRHGNKTHATLLEKLQPEQRHDPKIAGKFLPPIHANTPESREDWARYANIISEMDRQVGEILRRLDDDGLADNTVVIFWSDHGRGLPRGKRWIYDSGVHIPFMIRWPQQLKPAVNDELVNTEDLAATTLALAGIAPKDYLHGRVLVGPKKQPAPDMLFYHRDRMDEAQECMRAARDHQFKYIRNYETRRTYAQHIDYMDMMPTLVDLRRLNAEGKLNPVQKRFFAKRKPPEELYDIVNDPHETKNLAHESKYREMLRRMRSATEQWQDKIGDMGMIPESIMMERLRPGRQYQKTEAPVAERTRRGEVRLGCTTPGASISCQIGKGRWQLYTKAIPQRPGTVIRAKATRIGFLDSKVVELH
ncbi:MAG: sulfatase-like hydrolase/transferase [Limisphaerales bacterium]